MHVVQAPAALLAVNRQPRGARSEHLTVVPRSHMYVKPIPPTLLVFHIKPFRLDLKFEISITLEVE